MNIDFDGEDPRSWPEGTPQLIADALALRSARGVDLLQRIGSFNLWRGDLSAMRADTQTSAKDEGEPSILDIDRFHTVVALSEAMDYLVPRCAETVYLRYGRRCSFQEVARLLVTTDRYAEKLINNCTKRLFEAATNLPSANEPPEPEPELQTRTERSPTPQANQRTNDTEPSQTNPVDRR